MKPLHLVHGSLIVLALLLAGCSDEADQTALEPLPALSIDTEQVSVSGFSSGGYLANQLHVAYSDRLMGAGIFSAGPYGCANEGLVQALGKCMNTLAGQPDVDNSLAQTREHFASGLISDPDHLRNDRVYLYAGLQDSLIQPVVTEQLYRYYQVLTQADNIHFKRLPEAHHGMPTKDQGVPCDTYQSPFINDCDYDGAGAALQHIYGELNAPTEPKGQLQPFDQGAFHEVGRGFLRQGYVYIPTACAEGEQRCRLHIALHGCEQSAEVVDDAFYRNAGYNRWAESNNIVVLYPQAAASTPNPKGCWDWWGYQSKPFHIRNSVQPKAIMRMVDRLSGEFPVPWEDKKSGETRG